MLTLPGKPLRWVQSYQTPADGVVHTVLFRETLLGREAEELSAQQGREPACFPKAICKGEEKKHRARENP